MKTSPEVYVEIVPIPHKEISKLTDLQYLQTIIKDVHNTTPYDELIKDYVVSYTNAFGFPDIPTFVRQLPVEDKKHLYNEILNISIVTQEQLSNIGIMLEVQLMPEFKDTSWNCTECQAKGLDYTRACGFLPKDKRDSSPLLPRICGERVMECPISMLNGYVLSQASLAYNLFDGGVLPEDGGIGSQTPWFVQVAMLYKRKINEAERRAYESNKNS